MSANAISLIITGGTFDKAYDLIRGELTLSRTHLPEILTMVGCTVPVTPMVQTLKDSLDMDYADRLEIARVCSTVSERRVCRHEWKGIPSIEGKKEQKHGNV